MNASIDVWIKDGWMDEFMPDIFSDIIKINLPVSLREAEFHPHRLRDSRWHRSEMLKVFPLSNFRNIKMCLSQ